MFVFEILGAGLVLLAIGGETFLRGGIGLSKILGIPSVLVGLVIVSIGGATPEVAVALQAVTRDAPDIAVGCIVGANIFNLLFVLGLAALIRPIPAPPKIAFRDGGTMLVASLAFLVVARAGSVSTLVGIVLLAGFVLYFVLSFVTDWRRPAPLSLAESRALARKYAPTLETSTLLFGLGVVCLYFGARYVVESAAAVARTYDLPQAFIGLTIVTVGVGVPILLATLAASARGVVNVVVGQLIVANVLNILLVLGLAASTRPLAIPRTISQADAYVLVASAGLVVAMMLPGWRITRTQGAILLTVLALYVGFLAWRQGVLGL